MGIQDQRSDNLQARQIGRAFGPTIYFVAWIPSPAGWARQTLVRCPDSKPWCVAPKPKIPQLQNGRFGVTNRARKVLPRGCPSPAAVHNLAGRTV